MSPKKERAPAPKTAKEGEGLLQGKFFFNGDEACAEGAIAAGCRFFAGYPITPQSEIAERMAARLPQLGGTFMQMEDELSSLATALGASWGGQKAMTATSGPGFSLMMENIGLGMMTETPCVIVDIQRAGPSTGLPTAVSQGDVMQARWGSHGDYGVIAYAPCSPQEMYEHTIKAFRAAERFRMPVFVLGDEKVGHMRERVELNQAEVEQAVRREPTVPPEEYLPYEPEEDLVPSMASAGEGYRTHVTGLTHNERGYPQLDEETQQKLVQRLIEKVEKNKDEIIELEERETDEAEALIVSYGIAARTAFGALSLARQRGIKAGLLRLVTVWPFPEKRLRELSERVEKIVVPELNMGQISLEVERVVAGRAEVEGVTKAGGSLHRPEEIVEAIEGAS